MADPSDSGPVRTPSQFANPLLVGGVLFGFATGGAGGTFMAGNSTTETVREAKIEILGELRRMGDKVDDHGRRLIALEDASRRNERTRVRLELLEARLKEGDK